LKAPLAKATSEDSDNEVPEVIVRVLSDFDVTFETNPCVTAMAPCTTYAEKYTYRSRAIFLFQRVSGVDVLLFVMYVHEHGPDAPAPNKNTVYIAYLDSVHFFRPCEFRSIVYRELLVGYLEFSRQNGAIACYIWSCPPSHPKDDYILHCHPQDQRVPTPPMLRGWYHGLAKSAIDQGVVTSCCTLSEEHFENQDKVSWLGLGLRQSDLQALDPSMRTSRKQAVPLYSNDFYCEMLTQVAEAAQSKGNWTKTMALVEKAIRRQPDDFLVLKLAHRCSRCNEPLPGDRYECRHPDCSKTGFMMSGPFVMCDACFKCEALLPNHLQHGGLTQSLSVVSSFLVQRFFHFVWFVPGSI
jgi:E1A/CREB-binding protein